MRGYKWSKRADQSRNQPENPKFLYAAQSILEVSAPCPANVFDDGVHCCHATLGRAQDLVLEPIFGKNVLVADVSGLDNFALPLR